MSRFFKGLAAFLLAAVVVALPAAAQRAEVPRSQQTALDRYVAKPDAVYGWKLVNTITQPGYKAYVLELTSQSWRSAAEVDKPVWKHWLTVIKPDRLTSDKAALWIGSGSNTNAAPATAQARSVKMALETGSVVADLRMVPNQPLVFSDLPGARRTEDDLIAYSRTKQFATGDDEWLVRLAMVKSGVRAMDAVQEFMRSEAGGRTAINQFVVLGLSKRGWTTWLVGAVDPRVIGIVPMVIDALNSQVITRRHFEMLGFFAPSLGDYVNHGLFPHAIGTPEYARVMAIEDPVSYFRRDRLKIPKYVVNASGDQYFLPDNSQFYFPQMPQEKHLRIAPNTDHDLDDDANEGIIAFYQAVITGHKRPQMSWTKNRDGSITMRTRDKPTKVLMWQATNPKTRDFRVELIGRAYTSTELKPERNGSYVARVAPPPPGGFTAFYIEAHYPSAGKYPFKFTTEVRVTPDTVPFKWEDVYAKYPKRPGPGPAPPR